MQNYRRLTQKLRPIRYTSILIAVTLLLFMIGSTATAQEGDRVEFSNLPDGAVISQLTVVRGTIEFPNFLKYEIFLKSGNDLVWSGNSHTAIVNGNLIRLDPRVFESGSYQVIVRKVNMDSNYTDHAGPTITIDNPLDSPAPYYPEAEPSFLYPSKTFGIVRVRNCAGEDFNFDYASPDGFLSSGDMALRGKYSDDTICVFQDLALIPGHYRGTGQGGAQADSFPIDLMVDEWHVYEILYQGPPAGGQAVLAREVAADDPQADSSGGDPGQAATATPTAAPPPTPTPASAAPTPTTVPLPQTGTSDAPPPGAGLLPVTGNRAEAAVSVVVALGMILLLGAGGVMAIRKRRYN